jgi:hypothetical protein
VALAFVSIWVVLAAAATAMWLTEEVRVVGLVTVPAAIVAGLLVLYFDWRARVLRPIRAERDGRDELDKAA